MDYLTLKIGKKMVKVISAGFYTSIQDFGRLGFTQYGVSKSGVMDEKAAHWGNYLLQNDSNCALMEITFGACTLEFLANTCICITGADFSVTINGELVSMYKPFAIKKNSILTFGKKKLGVRTYIAIKGGFKTPIILGSRSFFKGITQTISIKKGDLIPYESFNGLNVETNSRIKIDTNYQSDKTIFCTPGPEFYLISDTQKNMLTSTEFSISNFNNRMGYQLNEILANDFTSMLTSSVLQGTVQLTPSGKLIILMRDCQVTGGYPRILQIKDESLNTLAQKSTGDFFKFAL